LGDSEGNILYSKNSFSFPGSMSQRLLGALAAIFIPLILGLGLIRSHLIINDPFASATIFQLRFIAKSLPRESVVDSRNLVLRKALVRRRSGDLFTIKPVESNLNRVVSASELVSSTQNAKGDLATITNHSAEVKAATLAQQFKGQSAIEAYQNARSDIQKLADRKGIALQAQRAIRYEIFQTAASNAVIPDCLAQGTTTKLGLDSFKGLLSIPALATAAAMGKCK
jgi:hypothetical protein